MDAVGALVGDEDVALAGRDGDVVGVRAGLLGAVRAGDAGQFDDLVGRPEAAVCGAGQDGEGAGGVVGDQQAPVVGGGGEVDGVGAAARLGAEWDEATRCGD